MKLNVIVTNYEINGWIKYLTIKDEDNNEFKCSLEWSEGNGYDLTWWDEEPEFYTNWDEESESMLFEQWLDEMSSK